MKLWKMANTWIAVVAVLVLCLAVDGFLFYRYQQTLESVDVARSTAETRPAAAQEAATAEETTDPPTGSPTEEEEAADVVRVGVSAMDEPSWLSVQEDGQAVLEQVSEPGFSEEFEEETTDPTTESPEEEVADALQMGVKVVDDPSWLSIQEDGQTVFEQVSEPGFSEEFEADQEIGIQTGNAGAVRVEVDGQDLGMLGASGEVTTRSYARQGSPS